MGGVEVIILGASFELKIFENEVSNSREALHDINNESTPSSAKQCLFQSRPDSPKLCE